MLNFGIIGTNWITHSFVTSAHSTSKWTLTAIYSRTPESASHFAAKYPDRHPTLYTSLASFFADQTMTAVYIASPNMHHFTHAHQALHAGKHVILEKPACSNAASLDALFTLAKEKRVFLIEAYRHIQEPGFQALQRALPRIQPIRGASFTYSQRSSRYDAVLAGADPPPNIFSLAMGGGALVDLGVYCVAAAIRLFGAPSEATYFPVKVATGADGAGVLVMRYPAQGGFVVQVQCSKMWDSGAPCEVYGEGGTVRTASVTDIEGVEIWDAGTKEKMGKREKAIFGMRPRSLRGLLNMGIGRGRPCWRG